MSFINALPDRAHRRFGDRQQRFGVPPNPYGNQSPYQQWQQSNYSPYGQPMPYGRPMNPYQLPHQYGQLPSPYGQQPQQDTQPQPYGHPQPYGPHNPYQSQQPPQPPQYGQAAQQQQPPIQQPGLMPNDPEACLSTHNTARAQKGVPPLQWSADLAQAAQQWADHLAHMNIMQHASQQDQGENLAMMMTNDPSASMSFSQAIQGWLDEEPLYHGERIGQGDLHAWGHYTQCLWRGTTHVGMAKARSRTGATFVVARYWPQGNVMGERPY